MTMGALHEGHATLVRLARGRADAVVVTIFLNPLQFGRNEDLAKYPRTFDADLELCTAEGVDLVFAPGPGRRLPGRRPGVRAHRCRPARGRPGGQEPARSLRRRAHRRRQAAPPDPPGPGVLRPEGRPAAAPHPAHGPRPRLRLRGRRRADRAGARRARDEQPQQLPDRARPRGGAHPAPRAAGRPGRTRPRGRAPSAGPRATSSIAEPLCLVDYLVLVHPATLDDVPEWYRGEALLAVAARVGTTRLIDNVPVMVGQDR